MVGEDFIDIGEPAIATQPSEGALHDVALGGDFKALLVSAPQGNIDP
jgi:hypothetical protein